VRASPPERPEAVQVWNRARGRFRNFGGGNGARMRAVFAIYLGGPLVGLALFFVIGFLGR
jgi:hypothetical protein